MSRVLRRATVIGAVALLAVAAMGAKCIENDQVYTDSEGYTHVVGEMVNETDVSATTVTLSAKLFDAQGNLLAETTGSLCPVSVQPNSRSVFDLKFPNPNIPNIDHYEVRPIAGTTIAQPLPDPDIFLIRFYAERIGPLVVVAGQVRNDSGVSYPDTRLCAAVYNNLGKVIRTLDMPIEGVLTPGQALIFSGILPDVPEEAVQFRLWFSTGSSGTQFEISDKVTIQ
jgi:hypothetical protein